MSIIPIWLTNVKQLVFEINRCGDLIWQEDFKNHFTIPKHGNIRQKHIQHQSFIFAKNVDIKVKHLSPQNINNPEITLAWSNLMYLCLECHNRIHGKKDERKMLFDDDGNLIGLYDKWRWLIKNGKSQERKHRISAGATIIDSKAYATLAYTNDRMTYEVHSKDLRGVDGGSVLYSVKKW